MPNLTFKDVFESSQYLLQNYPNAQDVRDYLNKRLDLSQLSKFKFGYFPRSEELSALTSLIGESSLEDLKLLRSYTYHDAQSSKLIKLSYFENYPLIIPFYDPYGELVALVGRTLLPEKEYKELKIPKYKNTVFHKGNFVFGLFENKESILANDEIYVVEGQFDVIKAVQAGLNNIVALGNNNMTAYQFSVISRYSANIFLLLDNDEAGEVGREKITKKFGQFSKITNLYLPKQYKDLDECLSSHTLSETLSMIYNS